jgi:hypothetical protein
MKFVIILVLRDIVLFRVKKDLFCMETDVKQNEIYELKASIYNK